MYRLLNKEKGRRRIEELIKENKLKIAAVAAVAMAVAVAELQLIEHGYKLIARIQE